MTERQADQRWVDDTRAEYLRRARDGHVKTCQTTDNAADQAVNSQGIGACRLNPVSPQK